MARLLILSAQLFVQGDAEGKIKQVTSIILVKCKCLCFRDSGAEVSSSKKHESGAIERSGLEMQVSTDVVTEATTVDDNTQSKTVEYMDKQPEESRIFRGGEGPRKERKWTMGSKKKH